MQALLERPGEIVTRDELRRRLWPENTFVDYELATKKAVNRLREVLGDSADSPHFIETIPRRGYRFIGSIAPPSTPAESSLQYPAAAEASTSTKPSTHSRAAFFTRLITTFALLAIAGVILWLNAGKLRTRIFATSRSAEIHSIAVLPLLNLSNDLEQEYFSDGMSDELITDLAKIGQLRVISRTSVMIYKKTNKALPQIARELGVDGIIEGSVQRSGNRVRVTAQLIDARSDRHLWAESYERDLKDILALQDEVARDIAAQVRINLTPQEQSRLTSERAINPRAYDAYLRGRYLWGQRNADAIDKAKGYFQQAVLEDPSFAPGYSGLSDCYWVGWGAKIDLPAAEQYAHKAVSLAPDLAEGHASLGIVRLSEYQIADAGRELRRAIELNPGYAMAHHFYSGYLMAAGRAEDALAENDRAKQLDPFSISINTGRVLILVASRNYPQAIDQAEKNAEITPQSAEPHNFMARIYWLQGNAPQAIAEERKAATLERSPERLRNLNEVAAAYEKFGFRVAQIESAKFMERDYQNNHEAIFVAFQYGNLKDKAKVLQWLEEARQNYDGNVYLALKTAPEFDFFRNDPRFQDLLRRLNLAS